MCEEIEGNECRIKAERERECKTIAWVRVG